MSSRQRVISGQETVIQILEDVPSTTPAVKKISWVLFLVGLESGFLHVFPFLLWDVHWASFNLWGDWDEGCWRDLQELAQLALELGFEPTCGGFMATVAVSVLKEDITPLTPQTWPLIRLGRGSPSWVQLEALWISLFRTMKPLPNRFLLLLSCFTPKLHF